MREIVTIELTWEQVVEKMEDILSRILGVNLECSTTQDDVDFWGVKLGGYRMSLEEVGKVCDYVGADESERKDAYPSDESESTVGDFGVDIANKLLALSLGIHFKKYLVEDKSLLLIDCRKNETIRIYGEPVCLDTLKSRNELLDFLYAEGANESSLLRFATDYEENQNNGLFWKIPIKDQNHLGVFFALVKEGVLYLPYDDADKTNGAIISFDDMKLADHSMVASYLRRFQSYYSATTDVLNDLCNYLNKKEKSNG